MITVNGGGDESGDSCWVVSSPGKVILFGEHAVVYGKKAIATSVSDLRTFIKSYYTNGGNIAFNALSCTSISLDMKAFKLKDKLTFKTKDFFPGCISKIYSNNINKDENGDIIDIYNPILLEDTLEYLKQYVMNQLLEIQKSSNDVDFTCMDVRKNSNLINPVVLCLYMYTLLRFHMEKQKKKKNLNHDVQSDSGPNVENSLHLSIWTELPIGAGLGSSASFSVTLSTSLLLAFGLIKLLNTKNDSEDQFSQFDYKLINSWSFLMEKTIHGTPSGIDNSVGTFGRVITLHRDAEGKAHLSHIPSEIVPHDILKILIVNTNVPRDSKSIITHVRQSKEKQPEKYNTMMDQVQECSCQCLDLFASYKKGNTSKSEFFEKLEKLIDTNHKLLNEMGTSHESLENMVQIARSFNLHAKLTGAGGGGCGFILLRDDFCDIKELEKRLQMSGFSCYQTRIGGPGVLVTRKSLESVKYETNH